MLAQQCPRTFDTNWTSIATHITHVATRPAVARKIATVVVQPRMFVQRLLTRSPVILRSFVISMIKSSKGGVEKPCTMPDQTSAFIGPRPRKLLGIVTTGGR